MYALVNSPFYYNLSIWFTKNIKNLNSFSSLPMQNRYDVDVDYIQEIEIRETEINNLMTRNYHSMVLLKETPKLF